jgi:rsbT co-antagonist protein RsbR
MDHITIGATTVSEILAQGEKSFLDEWIRELQPTAHTTGTISESELRDQCTGFLRSVRAGIKESGSIDSKVLALKPIKDLLADISRSRAVQGFTPTETATFVLSFKRPLFRRLREAARDPEILAQQIWSVSEFLDALGLYTTEVFLRTKEEMIRRAQEEMLELSTPVIKLWAGILALPLIGTLDSARTQIVMETLLDAIVATNSSVAIIDITGVPTVDTVVARHLIKTITAARLMGADCIISGIRPQIAQTIVHLGIDLLDVTSKATLKEAFALALERTGQRLQLEANS